MSKQTVKKIRKVPAVLQVRNKYRIQTMINGKRYSATRNTKQECLDWFYLLHEEHQQTSICLLELIDRYIKVASTRLKSLHRSSSIVNTLVREHTELLTTDITQITSKQLSLWRDDRLNQVSAGSVLLEMSFLSCVFNHAIKELYLLDNNPMDKVVKPVRSLARHRRISPEEEQRIIQWSGYEYGCVPDTCRKQVGFCFAFAIQTAMRRGEILALTAQHIHQTHVHIAMSKNGTSRDVPLTSTAKKMIGVIVPKEHKLFDIKEDNFNLLWRRMRHKLGIVDLHFHDTRHEAISRMVRDLNIPVEKLAKITGHKDIKTLVNVYYNPTVDELASYFN